MDQRIVAGLGNIYVCEALFRAGLDPCKPAARLATKTGKPTPAAERLVAAIKAVLRSDPRRRLDLRDYKQADGYARPLPERVCRLRPRRRALLEARLPGQGAAQDAGRALDLLLPGLPALTHPARSMEQAHGVRDHHRRNQGPRRHRPAQPPQRAQRAQRPADRRAVRGARRLRGRRRHRLHRHHRQREGVRRRRRHQGDAGQDLHAGLQGGLHLQVGPGRRAAASRWSRRWPASRWAAAASSP